LHGQGYHGTDYHHIDPKAQLSRTGFGIGIIDIDIGIIGIAFGFGIAFVPIGIRIGIRIRIRIRIGTPHGANKLATNIYYRSIYYGT
jgi:hypothetical protein